MSVTMTRKPISQEVLAALTESELFKSHEREAEKRIAIDRAAAAAALAKGDAETLAEIRKLEALGAEAFARQQEKIAEVREASEKLNAITLRRHAISNAWDRTKTALEYELAESSSPAISEFVVWCDAETDRVCKAQPVARPSISVHPITGRRTVEAPEFKAWTPGEVAEAIRRARSAALEMRLVPDQSGVADALAELKRNVPIIGARKD